MQRFCTVSCLCCSILLFYCCIFIDAQAVQFKIAEMASALNASRQSVRFAARQLDLKHPCVNCAVLLSFNLCQPLYIFRYSAVSYRVAALPRSVRWANCSRPTHASTSATIPFSCMAVTATSKTIRCKACVSWRQSYLLHSFFPLSEISLLILYFRFSSMCVMPVSTRSWRARARL